MAANFVPITDAETLNQLVQRSHSEPVLLFKHSTTCPISSAAHREITKVTVPVSLVVVQTARDVSREVEARTGVRHESPQAIVIRNGTAVWNASHFDITAEAVTQAMKAHAA